MRPNARPANRLASMFPPNAKMCRAITVRVRYNVPRIVIAIITSIGTGYSPPRSPSDALVTPVNEKGTRMLSALVATNAMPRRTHIVPSVMMNGCTRSPTTSIPLSSPHTKPKAEHSCTQPAHQADADARYQANDDDRARAGLTERAKGERHAHAGQRID